MTRVLVVLLASLISPTLVFAQQLDIKPEHRRNNDTGIQCVWSTLETLAKYHGIAAASDIATNNRNRSGPGPASAELRRRGVKFEMSMVWDSEFQTVKQFCDKGWGCLIGVGRGAHAVTCVGYDKDGVFYIDNLDPKKLIRKYTTAQFLGTWDGWALALVPPERRPIEYRFRGTGYACYCQTK